jgi:hypothetical protein
MGWRRASPGAFVLAITRPPDKQDGRANAPHNILVITHKYSPKTGKDAKKRKTKS